MGDFNDPFMRNRDAAIHAHTKARNHANVLQLKLIGQSHPTGLTFNLLKLFEPKAPLEYKPPQEKRKCPSYSGFLQLQIQGRQLRPALLLEKEEMISNKPKKRKRVSGSQSIDHMGN